MEPGQKYFLKINFFLFNSNHFVLIVAQDHDGTADIDPEVIRKGVRSLMQQVAQVERERVSLNLFSSIFMCMYLFKDDMKTQVSTMKKQLQEAQDTQSKGDTKVTKLMSNLRTLQDEKGSLEAKLGQKTKALQAQVLFFGILFLKN